MRQTVTIPPAEIDRQLALCDQIHTLLEDRPGQKLAFVDTYGCQQNEADSERLRGYLARMGYAFSDTEEGADLVLLNTCAVREHAEQRVFGNVGALSHTKRRHPGQIICVCGCMARQEHVVERLKKSFPYVDLVFGPQLLWQFPELLLKKMTEGKRVFAAGDEIGTVAEGIPTVRQNRLKGWVSIMYGCNNFCTYCIVPYVRGRERSRQPQEILDEVRSLVDAGYKDITLLGQNVNSYGKDLDLGVDFAWLLEQVNAIPGDFLIRFMTSHPKDAGPRLFDAMAACEKVAPVLHLPFQSGSSRVLKAMNRRGGRKEIEDAIARLRAAIPGITLRTTLIAGFPGETEEQYAELCDFVKTVRFDRLGCFAYSAEENTVAAKMPNQIDEETKQRRADHIMELQAEVSAEREGEKVGHTYECICDGVDDETGMYLLRTKADCPEIDGSVLTPADTPLETGAFYKVTITDSDTYDLYGYAEERLED